MSEPTECTHCNGHGYLPDGSTLRNRRVGEGLPLRSVASEVGISLNYLSMLERGVRVLNWPVYYRVCEAITRLAARR